MALATHAPDQFNNVVAEEGFTICICGCKYWENDKCIDCGMTPERLWIIQHAEAIRIMQKMRLNTMFTSMLYYDLPWLNVTVSDALDVTNVIADLDAVPRYGLSWADPLNVTFYENKDN